MAEDFRNCYAFILEGETELEFYRTMLSYLCAKYSVTMENEYEKFDDAPTYILISGAGKDLVRFKLCKSGSKIPKGVNWFAQMCLDKYGPDNRWTVFLCYDTDAYDDYVSAFKKGDESKFSKILGRAEKVKEMPIDVNIEEAFLLDTDAVTGYVKELIERKNRELAFESDRVPKRVFEMPRFSPNEKGKAAMKKLYRENGLYYNSGRDAGELIRRLDMNIIVSSDRFPFKELEDIIFGNAD